MPTYTHQCSACQDSFDEVRMMREPEPTVCAKCGGELRQILDKPMIMGDTPPYKSIVTGELVSGRAAHREHLKRNDLMEVGDQKPKWMQDRQSDT